MKKLVACGLIVAVGTLVFAQEQGAKAASPQQEEIKRESTTWPAFFAISEFPASPDLVGLRLTIPFSTKQENVTGIDLGLWGRAIYFEGIQASILRNDVKDNLSGAQIGFYNTVLGGQLLGLQVGLFNEVSTMRGIQVGLINLGGEVQGFQVGLINRSETMFGYQIGLINVIRDAELSFFPIVNIGF